jgi:hypothetical protein
VRVERQLQVGLRQRTKLLVVELWPI